MTQRRGGDVVAALSVRNHLDAVVARLAAYATGAGIDLVVYRVGEVPQLPEYPYVVVYPTQRLDSSRPRLSDDSTTRPFRFLTEFWSDSTRSILWLEEQIDAALRGYRLTVSGCVCGPMHFEPARGVVKSQDQDDLYSGMSGWTFVSTLQ